MTDLSNEEILARVRDWLSSGRVEPWAGILGPSDPLSRDADLKGRDRSVVEWHRRFDDVPERNRAAIAHRRLMTYRERAWQKTRMLPQGGHKSGSLEHLAWQIFRASPAEFGLRRYRQIVRQEMGSG